MSEDYVGNFSVKLVRHSVNPVGEEVITWLLCYERFIHAEFMTHRWSRNGSSSRAIPFKRMSDWIDRDPALPLHWGKNKQGMQSSHEEVDIDLAIGSALGSLADMKQRTNWMISVLDLHKEIVNRYLEPWGWINVVATMGKAQLMNFFTLRCAREANPNMQRLAVTMARLYRASRPYPVLDGDWHLPFTEDLNRDLSLMDKLAYSVARCAWTSYMTVVGKDATLEEARNRHDRCMSFKHMTPFEHQYKARSDHECTFGRGCVPGWTSYRSLVPGEYSPEFDFSILDTVYKDSDYVV